MFKKNAGRIAVIVGGLLLVVGVGFVQAPAPQVVSPHVELAGVRVEVELARSHEEIVKGLSGRASLPVDKGMLFVFSPPQRPSFWMKEMRFPLDMIWIDGDGVIADLSCDVVPETYPQTFTPRDKIQYVLELNAGFCREYSLEIGDVINVKL